MLRILNATIKAAAKLAKSFWLPKIVADGKELEV